MSTAFDTPFEALPEEMAIFPLPGVILLPRTDLPLNIFEKRYIAMIDHALQSHRLIGMVQPQLAGHNDNTDPNAVYEIGGAGRISSFQETPDGRYIITLTGICRFHIIKELAKQDGYRRIVPDWTAFKHDMTAQDGHIDRHRLLPVLRTFLDKRDMICDKWDDIPNIEDEKLINCLSMICPFDTVEKQALLEATDLKARAETLYNLLKMSVGMDDKDARCH